MIAALPAPEGATPELKEQFEEGKRAANKMLHYVPVVNAAVALNNVLSGEDTSEYLKEAAKASLVGTGISWASTLAGPIGKAVGLVIGTGMSLGDLVYDTADFILNPSFDGGVSTLLDVFNFWPYIPTSVDDAVSIIGASDDALSLYDDSVGHQIREVLGVTPELKQALLNFIEELMLELQQDKIIQDAFLDRLFPEPLYPSKENGFLLLLPKKKSL